MKRKHVSKEDENGLRPYAGACGKCAGLKAPCKECGKPFCDKCEPNNCAKRGRRKMTKHEWPKQKDGSLKPMRELTRNQQREQFDFAMERLAKEFAPLGIEVVNGEKEKDHMN